MKNDQEDSDREKEPIKEEMVRKKEQIPPQLLISIPLDPNDPDLAFYRETRVLNEKSKLTMVRMGWLLAKLTAHQEDTVLYLFATLQSAIRHPLSFLTTTNRTKG